MPGKRPDNPYRTATFDVIAWPDARVVVPLQKNAAMMRVVRWRVYVLARMLRQISDTQPPTIPTTADIGQRVRVAVLSCTLKV